MARNSDFGRHAFFTKTNWNNLHPRDRKTVSYVKYNVHGLTSQPRREERGHEYSELDDVISYLYDKTKTEERTLVAYKGGHVERDLLLTRKFLILIYKSMDARNMIR